METLGEKRVRSSFNPGANDKVSEIKQKAAELINLVNSLPVSPGPSEKGRLIALAITDFESGAMWAVKAITCTQEHEKNS